MIYYNKDQKNKILGKCLLPNIDFKFKLNKQIIIINFFDFEFEINDLKNSKELINSIIKILGEKLKSSTIFIEPCLIQMKTEFEKINNNNNEINNNNNNFINENEAIVYDNQNYNNNNNNFDMMNKKILSIVEGNQNYKNSGNNNKNNKNGKNKKKDNRGLTQTLNENDEDDENSNLNNEIRLNDSDDLNNINKKIFN